VSPSSAIRHVRLAAGIVEEYLSRWQRGTETGQRVPAISAPPEVPPPTPYHAARQAVSAGLIEDAASHDAGRFAEIGRGFPAVRETLSRGNPPWDSRLQLAFRFWRGWALARDGRWRVSHVERPMVVADWPRFARMIAADLALDRETMDPAIVGRFAYAIAGPIVELPPARIPQTPPRPKRR
jgi:hypothetical protein